MKAPLRPGKEKSWSGGKNNLLKAQRNSIFPIHKPIIDLTKEQYKLLWEGNEHVKGINDFFKEVEQNLYKVQYRVLLSRYRGRTSLSGLRRLPPAQRSTCM